MSDTAERPVTGSRRFDVLLGLLVLCVGGGATIGAVFGGQASAYVGLDLPAWAPPAYLFGPVWTVLYGLMAISAWLVWRERSAYRRRAFWAFAVQLALNFAWTPAFFGLGNPLLGLAVIVGVLLAAGWWALEAWRSRTLAGALQLPYVAWVVFATALNLAIALNG